MNSNINSNSNNSFNIVAFTFKDYRGDFDTCITDEKSFDTFKFGFLDKVNLIRNYNRKLKFNKSELQYLWGDKEQPCLDIEIISIITVAYDVKESQLKKFNLNFVSHNTYKELSTKTKQHFKKIHCGDFWEQKTKEERYGTSSFQPNTWDFLKYYLGIRQCYSYDINMKNLGEMDIDDIIKKVKIIIMKKEFNKQFLESEIYNPKTLIGRLVMNNSLINDGLEEIVSPWVSPIYINKFTAYIRR